MINVTGCNDAEWIHLAQERDQWHVLTNTVLKHHFTHLFHLQCNFVYNYSLN
jgi:hypothetical protein